MRTKYYQAVLPVLIFGISIFSVLGCKKLVEAELPVDKLTSKAVFNDVGGASAALLNIYYIFPVTILSGESGFSVRNGLSSDELVLRNMTNPRLNPYYMNSLSATTISNWSGCYDLIFRVNSIIEGVENSAGLLDHSKNELIGQAKFFRAFVYFYLVNLYGGVPILTSTDYKVNMLLPRSNESEVYDQIVKDLIESQSLVNQNYLKPDLLTISAERVTANKAAVTALLARVYLYNKQWQKAEQEATKVINDSRYSILESLDDVFKMNSGESIFQIEGDVSKGQNSADGSFFLPASPGVLPTVYLSDNLLKEMSLDDKRRQHWLNFVSVGSNTFYYPYKYKKLHPVGGNGITTEYNMILRLAEQYLIRSEARAQLNNQDGSINDLNVIRKRAGVSLYTSLNKEELLRAIERERQVELFSECGHRWFDLTRTGRADAVLGPVKGSNWQSTDKLFPIPTSEFLNNPSLRGHQNPGYAEN